MWPREQIFYVFIVYFPPILRIPRSIFTNVPPHLLSVCYFRRTGDNVSYSAERRAELRLGRVF